MKHNTLKDEFGVIGSVEYFPSVSIIMPFEPKMSLKTELQHNLKLAVEKVEKELRSSYTKEKVNSILPGLKQIVAALDYMTYKKSIAIFVSPIFQKAYYLDIPVEEKVIVDGSFEIRDLVYNKKEMQKYLVLVLNGEWTRIYLGNSLQFMKIVSNLASHINAYRNDMPERTANFFDPSCHREGLLKKFLRHTDEGLTLLLRAYPLPLFVMGADKTLGYFKNITHNTHHIVNYVHGNFTHSNEAAIRKAIEPYIADWKKVKQKDLLNRLEHAAGNDKLARGMSAVWKEAAHKRVGLLVVEKNFMVAARLVSAEQLSYTGLAPNRIFLKDAVDDVIEKVLEAGGDVEFVEDGLLKEYDHIALVL